MWIFAHILWSIANNNPVLTKRKPYVPLFVHRFPIDCQAIVEYAYHHNFPLLLSLPTVRTQGTAIHISNGIWVTAAHVVSGGLDVYLSPNEDIRIKAEIIGLDVHHDIALLSTNETFLTYPVIQKLDFYDPVYEKLIRAEGYGNGELTINKVQNIRYSVIESGIILWDGMVKPGMSGGMLGKNSTNEMLGMILSYEPSKNISRALSIDWIIEHFSELISREESVHMYSKTPHSEKFCSYHQILFEPVAEGLKVAALSSNNYNLGIQVGDIIENQGDIPVNCDMLSVPRTSLMVVKRNNMSFYWIIYPQ